MPPVASISGLRDNHSRGSVGDFLRHHLKAGADLDLVTAYFTVFAYDKLRTELNHLGKIRLLFGEAAFIKNVDPERKDGAAYVLKDDGLTLSNGLNQRHLARACADWMRDKVEVRSVTKTGFLHGKMSHIRRGEVSAAIVGSSNFTTRGLGLAATNNNVELNLVVDSNRDRDDLQAWFEALWNDTSRVECVKERVLDYLLQVYADQTPEFIYYKTLFELFRRYIDEGVAIDEALHQLRLPDTAIWKALYGFQRDGARSAINKIKQYNGCILADSVGLGKTYTALAVIKYFELRNDKVLVLCPKKLRRNWIVYRQPSALNPFERDRFGFHVLHHTDLSHDAGESNGLLLSGFNWGAYDLVVIDESHNFRNNKSATQRPGDKKPRRTRYERLMEDIISAGAKTKVLLLSATPVNNQLADLRNQISFIAGGDVARNEEANAAFAQKLGVASVRDTTRLAQTHFTRWADQTRPPEQRKTRDLIAAIGGDFFKLLDGLSIARSRRQIATYYATEMKALGGFPHRPPPKAVHAHIDLKQSYLTFEELDTEIGRLRLALYHPTSFLRGDLPAATAAAYQDKILSGFTQEGREKILIAMMKINFLKRLESSVDSFRLTLERTIAKIDFLEKRITAFEAHLDENPDLDFDALTPEEFEDPDFDGEDFTIGGRRRIHLGHLKLPEWLKAVRHDRTQLQFLLEKTQAVTVKRDGKLAELKQLIAEKVRHPTVNRDGKANRKVLVFTAFADTARYLYEHLEPWVAEMNRERGGPPLPASPPGPASPAALFLPFDRKGAVSITRQNLPHWVQPGATYFVTYRLADSLPREILAPWREEIELWLSRHPEPWDDAVREEYQQFHARKEAWLDAGYGSCHLGNDKARAIVEENFRHFDGDRYILDEFVVMPNHVHVLVKPLGDSTLSDILHSWKSYTSKAIAKVVAIEGPVWMDESFDHIVRTWEQLQHYRAYIRANPKTKNLQSNLGRSPLIQVERDRGGSPLLQGGSSRGRPPFVKHYGVVPLHAQGQAAPVTPVLHTALICGDGGNAASLGRTDFDRSAGKGQVEDCEVSLVRRRFPRLTT